MRANNLSTGLAFELETNGPLGGSILSGKPGDGSKPFVTNATGVATGLNTDRVDSKDATDLIKDAASAAAAAVTDLLRLAQVDAAGRLGSKRCVASAAKTGLPVVMAGTYQVVFKEDVSKCALTVTQTTNTGAPDRCQSSSARTKGGHGRDVRRAGALADRPFHLAATC